jgi:hypothetical protein
VWFCIQFLQHALLCNACAAVFWFVSPGVAQLQCIISTGMLLLFQRLRLLGPIVWLLLLT